MHAWPPTHWYAASVNHSASGAGPPPSSGDESKHHEGSAVEQVPKVMSPTSDQSVGLKHTEFSCAEASNHGTVEERMDHASTSKPTSKMRSAGNPERRQA